MSGREGKVERRKRLKAAKRGWRTAGSRVAAVALCFTASWVASEALASAAILEFEVRESQHRNLDPTTASTPVEFQAEYRMEVRLGSGFIEYSKGEQMHRVLDFIRERSLIRESEQSGYKETSIYADLGFRLYEFQNRLFLNSLMGKVGTGKRGRWAPVYVEHLFSLQADDAAELNRRESRRMVAFSHERDVLLRYSVELERVDAETQRRFVVFLRNAYGIHPRILTELQSLEGLPRQIEIARFDHSNSRRILVLKSVSQSDYELDRSRFKGVVRYGEEELQPLSQLALGASDAEREQRLDALVEEAVALAGAGQSLDAMLLFFEYTLCTGEDLPAEFFDHRERLMQDDQVQILFRALETSGSAELDLALENLRRLNQFATGGRRSLNVFLANALASQGESVSAKALLLDSLRGNPFLVGAWKDLGDIYYGQYDARSAWLCWDTGRSLEPSPKLFQQVYEFERTLRTDRPEFFLMSDLD